MEIISFYMARSHHLIYIDFQSSSFGVALTRTDNVVFLDWVILLPCAIDSVHEYYKANNTSVGEKRL